MKIRNEQMDVLNAHMRPTLVDPLVGHMREHFPEHCETLGDARLRQTVELGLERASQYGLLAEREVFLYVSLMFVLGRDFDTDPQLPWSKRILNDPELDDPSEKTGALYDEAESHLEQEEGPLV